jgi:hypothetical protein
VWRLRENAWAIGITAAITTALWVYGPVYWVVRKNPDLSVMDFYTWARAGWDYKYFLPISFAPLVTLVCISLILHFLPRIRARGNVVVKKIVEQNRAFQAEFDSQREVLNNAALAHEKLLADLQRRETDFQATVERNWADLDSREATVWTALRESEELNEKLQSLKADLHERSKAIELKEFDLTRREQSLLPLETQLIEQKKVIQAQAIEAREILDQAKRDAQVTKRLAEAEASDILDQAAQEARAMVAREKVQCKQLWEWCHYKAKSADVTPEEWREVKSLRQKLLQTQDNDVSPGDETNQRREAVTKPKVELSGRQIAALHHIREHCNLTIQDFEKICPDVNRRTLQRDLRGMVDNGILTSQGASNQMIYQLATSCDTVTGILRHDAANL